MLNTLKRIIDQSKAVSETDTMYFIDGVMFNYGNVDQYIKVSTDVKNDNKSMKLGLDKMKFKINYQEFLKFEKEYKKDFTEIEETKTSYILKTKIPNVNFELEKIDSLDFDVIVPDEDMYIGSVTASDEAIQTLIKNTVIHMYLDFDNQSVVFEEPTDSESYLYVSILTNNFPKITKSETKSIIFNVYQYGDGTTNEYLVQCMILNKDIINDILFVTVDSPSE